MFKRIIPKIKKLSNNQIKHYQSQNMPKHEIIIDDKSHEYSLPHAIYKVNEIKEINEVHVETKGLIDKLA